MARRPFHQLLSRLALVAALLLVSAPSVGRLLAPATMAKGGYAPLCTVDGLRLVALVEGQRPHPRHPPADGDCPYCPLLGNTVALSPPRLVLAPHEPARFEPALAAVRPWQRHPSGLGSRGPPVLA